VSLSQPVFVDSWAWIALASAGDQYHASAKSQHDSFRRERRSYVTTDLVLVEVITHLYRKQDSSQAERYIESVRKTIESGRNRLVHVSPDQFEQAWQLRKKYSDKPNISFTDLTSMVVMKELSIVDVFSGDAHFEHVGMGFRRLL